MNTQKIMGYVLWIVGCSWLYSIGEGHLIWPIALMLLSFLFFHLDKSHPLIK